MYQGRTGWCHNVTLRSRSRLGKLESWVQNERLGSFEKGHGWTQKVWSFRFLHWLSCASYLANVWPTQRFYALYLLFQTLISFSLLEILWSQTPLNIIHCHPFWAGVNESLVSKQKLKRGGSELKLTRFSVKYMDLWVLTHKVLLGLWLQSALRSGKPLGQ